MGSRRPSTTGGQHADQNPYRHRLRRCGRRARLNQHSGSCRHRHNLDGHTRRAQHGRAAPPGLAIFADITTSNYLDTCRTSSLTGSLRPGSGLPGRGIGSVTALSLSRCFDGTTYTSSGFPWQLDALTYNAATGVAAGRVSGIHLAYTSAGSPGCSGIVDGTSPTADNGTTRFRYNNATHTLRFIRGGTLHVYHNTCPPPWHNGDQLAFGGSYTLSPAQAITSP
jgi:hypothetical protein